MAIMRWHTKCTTQVQKIARKFLRANIRSLEIAKSVDLSKVDALTAFNLRRDIESMQRIVEAFEKAHTDAELKIALHFAMQFNPYDDDESPARPRH
jgi:predicted GTPase